MNSAIAVAFALYMKKRLDVLIHERGLAESREKAKIFIMEGLVYVDNQKSDKPGSTYDEDCKIEVRNNKLRYVSRGGLKLEKAIAAFELNLNGLVAMDIGASTGGFTDCMLQNGCKKVYSVDVGYGQLDWKLRNDPRVVNMERTNIRYIDQNLITDVVDFFSVDVSFISLRLVLPVARQIIKQGGFGVCLIKPQFEAGREKVGKKGVVRDKNVHIEVIEKICNFCVENGFSVIDLNFSPVKGPEGNIEYLVLIQKTDETSISDKIDIKNVVNISHEEL